MGRRRLTEEEIEEIIETQDGFNMTELPKDKKLAKKYMSLTGARTKEGKRNILKKTEVGTRKKNATPTLEDGQFIKEALNDVEQEYFENRRDKYLQDFEINSSGDEALLNMALMEELNLFRLYREKFKNLDNITSKKIEEQISYASKRLNQTLDNLGMLRKTQQEQDNKIKEITIAKLAEQYARNRTERKENIEKMRKEEEELLKKKEQEMQEVIEVDYEAEEQGEENVED